MMVEETSVVLLKVFAAVHENYAIYRPYFGQLLVYYWVYAPHNRDYSLPRRWYGSLFPHVGIRGSVTYITYVKQQIQLVTIPKFGPLRYFCQCRGAVSDWWWLHWFCSLRLHNCGWCIFVLFQTCNLQSFCVLFSAATLTIAILSKLSYEKYGRKSQCGPARIG